MSDLIIHITRNHLFGLGSLLGLGITSYLIRRYMNNTEKTSNSHYLQPDEITSSTTIISNGNNINNNINNNKPPVDIYWNGDINSTYLLIDLLLQDYPIQPLYVQRYTIIKTLEHETLEKYITQYNKTHIQTDPKIDPKIKTYLEDIARIKQKQKKEMAMINLLRRVIINQYPEFKNRLLPTQYITMIAKDLPMTQQFYNQIQHISPLAYQGIEFYEQACRFIKHANLATGRILIGYSKNSRLIGIINKIEKTLYRDLQPTQIIELPLRELDNEAIRYLATDIVKNDVMRVLLPTRN